MSATPVVIMGSIDKEMDHFLIKLIAEHMNMNVNALMEGEWKNVTPTEEEIKQYINDKNQQEEYVKSLEERFRKMTEYQRRYYQENRERLLEYSKKYYQENKAKMTEYHKAYYQENREELNDYHRRYYQENKDKFEEYRQRYYQKNRAKIIETSKKYYKDNKEKLREYQKNYYAKHREEILQKQNEKLREKVQCMCGTVCGRGSYSAHLNSKKHRLFVLLQR